MLDRVRLWLQDERTVTFNEEMKLEQLVPGKESILTDLNRLYGKEIFEWVLAVKSCLLT